jgi:hypothetical protein
MLAAQPAEKARIEEMEVNDQAEANPEEGSCHYTLLEHRRP